MSNQNSSKVEGVRIGDATAYRVDWVDDDNDGEIVRGPTFWDRDEALAHCESGREVGIRGFVTVLK